MSRSRILRESASLSLALLLIATTSTATAGPPEILGFAPRSVEKEQTAEARALAVPTPENARKWLRVLTAEPHVAGTPADRKTAEFVRDKLREWGWKADLVEMKVLLNYPQGEPSLQVRRPHLINLPLNEAPLAVDKDSASSDAFGAFNGYGTSGQAYGQVVYANYGRPDDFAALEKMGIDVKGKVVLVRYGEVFRGLKVYNAQKREAAGILIFSDPADDGYAKGETYPDGRFRPESAIQRGSVQFLSHGPGDPSTPFGPSVEGAKRLPFNPIYGFNILARSNVGEYNSVEHWEKTTGLKRDEYFATIPSLPISYGTAREILKLVAGPNVPTGWQGGLPMPYHVGPGPAEVAMSVSMDYQLRPIWNVIATLPGAGEPDRWVMIGNHRDAWVYGAVDPGSGTAATMETCRALGEAVKHGWKPRRTLVYASWDAEEYGLVGSTEWAEAHADELKTKAVLMLNVDVAVTGPEVGFSGIPSLRDFTMEAAAAVVDVRTGKNLRDSWVASRREAWAAQSSLILDDPAWGDQRVRIPKEPRVPLTRGPHMNPLGSGSDYTVFVDHLGIPALDIGLHGGYGVYHSIYDNFRWMEKFGDPEFLNHATAAKLYTAILMRAAAAEVVPMRFQPYAEALRGHVDELRLIAVRKKRKSDNRILQPGTEFEGVRDLIAAVKHFEERAHQLDTITHEAATHDHPNRDRLATLNDAITAVERSFLLGEGLPGRPWFRHAIYAPGLTTGYASWPLPAVRQAIEDGKPEALAKAVAAACTQIRKAAGALDTATRAGRAVGNQ